MVYKAIGIMSGSALEGLDIIYAHFHERGGQWSVELLHKDHYEYSEEWLSNLRTIADMPARDYVLLDIRYGQLIGQTANQFIAAYNLAHRVDLIASHGHTVLLNVEKNLNPQIGNGAAIAAITGLPVVSNLLAMDSAFGGNGSSISGISQKLFAGEGPVIEMSGALTVALHGVLRWREEYTMLASQTGALRNSIGGALWLGGEA